MLGFETEWDFECLVFGLTQIEVVLGLGFIAKQRSGLGFDYMLFAQCEEITRGHFNSPCIKLVTQAFKVTISHFILSHYS